MSKFTCQECGKDFYVDQDAEETEQTERCMYCSEIKED